MTPHDTDPAPIVEAGPALAKNVIFMVPDGFGDVAATAYRLFRGIDPAWESGRQALVKTHSASHQVTDSAAAATAYATGVKTYNGAIAVDVNGEPLVSVLDLASDAGKATGLVSTDVITGATLAAFAASNADRDNYAEIAQDYVDNGDLDVILGGGRESFVVDADGDGSSTLEEATAAGFDHVTTSDELAASEGDRLLGLFNYGPMTLPIGERSDEPSLAEMTEAALTRLSGDEDGFFLVVEEAGTDIWGHANDAAAVMRSAGSFEDALIVARDFAEAYPGTLVISVADHETGGMTLDLDGDRTPAAFRGYAASYGEMVLEILGDIAELGPRACDPEGVVATVQAAVSDLTGGAVSSLTEDDIESILGAESFEAAYLALGGLLNARGGVEYSTTGHTGDPVSLYAFGAGADLHDGEIDNTMVGHWLAEAMGLSLPPDQRDREADAVAANEALDRFETPQSWDPLLS
jgi:alkaline phosphatase